VRAEFGPVWDAYAAETRRSFRDCVRAALTSPGRGIFTPDSNAALMPAAANQILIVGGYGEVGRRRCLIKAARRPPRACLAQHERHIAFDGCGRPTGDDMWVSIVPARGLEASLPPGSVRRPDSIVCSWTRLKSRCRLGPH
jgi:hypothetical protein